MKYVIIGNSAAAIGAVEGIRKNDQKNPITIISAEQYHTYSRPLISYYLAGKVKEDKMFYRPQDFYQKNNVDFIHQTAKDIDPKQKQVKLEDGSTVEYDKLLIATGGKPFVPPIQGLDKKKIYTFQKWDDVKEIEKIVPESKKVVILGAGLIGMKAAEALAYRGLDVTVVELSDRVLSSILDNQGAAFIQEAMEEQGVKYIFKSTVKEVLGDKEATGVLLSDGQQLACDFFIVAIGVVPNTDVAKKSEIQINRGILINNKMETNIPDVYAAGDVSEGMDCVMNIQRVIPILPNAYKQGETAGINMTGKEVGFDAGFAMNAIGFFGYPMTTAGILGGSEGEYEEYTFIKPEDKVYRKLVLKGNNLVGYIAIKDINRTGMLTSLIAGKTNVTPFKDALIEKDLGYVDWPKELRKERMQAGGGLLW